MRSAKRPNKIVIRYIPDKVVGAYDPLKEMMRVLEAFLKKKGIDAFLAFDADRGEEVLLDCTNGMMYIADAVFALNLKRAIELVKETGKNRSDSPFFVFHGFPIPKDHPFWYLCSDRKRKGR